MRMPLELLAEKIAEATIDNKEITLGELAKMFDQTVERIMDAIDLIKVKCGEITYI